MTLPSVARVPDVSESHISLPSNDDSEKAHNQYGTGEEETEDAVKYPSAVSIGLMFVAISFAMFLVSLDRTIVATAVPQITNEFHSLDDVAWYASAYALTGCTTQLLLGRFYTFYTPKWVFVSLVTLFEVGSAICAGAFGSKTIIIGRAVQGIGCAGVFSGSMILLVENVPLHRRPMFMGLLMAIMSVSAIIGPLIGGALTDNASWRCCFIINLPIGAITIVILVLVVKGTPGKEQQRTNMDKLKHLDPPGAALLMPAVVCLILALQWGGSVYAWSNWRIILLLALSGLLAVGFTAVQIRMPGTATVAPHIIKQRTVASSVLYSTCSGGAMLAVVYWLPIWFQAIKNASPLKSGEMTIPLLVSQSLGSIVAGIMVSQLVGYSSPFMLLGSVLMAVGAGLLSTLSTTSGPAQWMSYQVIFGLGLGLGMQQPATAVQAVLKKDDIPSAVSLIFFGLQLGGSICVCIGQNIFNQQLIKKLKEADIAGLDPAAILHIGATELGNLVYRHADREKLLVAYDQSLTDIFYVATGVAAVSIGVAALVEWKSVKGLKPVS